MKKTVFLMLSLFVFIASANSENVKQYIVSLLKTHAPYHDMNPSRQDETAIVNALFIQAVGGFHTFEETEKRRLRTKAFSLLYDNASSLHDDSKDVDRMHTRRMLCFMTIALLSDEERFETLIKYALFETLGTREFYRSQNVLLVHLTTYLLMTHFDFSAVSSINTQCRKIRDFFSAKQGQFLEDNISYFNNRFENDFSALLQKIRCE